MTDSEVSKAMNSSGGREARERSMGDLWGLTPLQETVDNYLFRGLDGDSRLVADCVRRMLRSRSGQSDRLEDDDAGAGDPLPLSRGEGAPHHGQTVKSRQAADFSRKRSANLKARNRAAAPRTWSGATGSLRIEPSDGLTLPGFAALYWTQSITSGWSPVLRTARLPAGATRTTEPSFTGMFTPSTWYSPLPEPLS